MTSCTQRHSSAPCALVGCVLLPMPGFMLVPGRRSLPRSTCVGSSVTVAEDTTAWVMFPARLAARALFVGSGDGINGR